jgi:hypothetical protein
MFVSSIAGPVGVANLLVKSDKSPVALLAFEEEEKRLTGVEAEG